MAHGSGPSGAPPGSAHNPWLDLLRSLAIVLVLLRHGHRSALNEFGLASGPAGNAMLNGWVGVDLFLVLSGYLIGRQLLRGLQDTAAFDWPAYLMRRGFRIVPSYVAVLALVMLGAFPLYVFPREALAFRGFYHLLLLQDYLPPNISIVFWTLGVEEKFYLVAPLLIALCLRAGPLRTRLMILALVFVASPLLRALTLAGTPLPLDYPTYFHGFRRPFHACLEPLAAGVAIALAERAGGLSRFASSSGAILASAALALLIWLASHDLLAHIVAFDVVLQPALIALLCAAMVLGAVLSARRPLPFAPAAQMLATLSYTLYLVHFPLIPLAMALGKTTPHPLAGFWVAYLGLSTLAAIALHLAVERPFLNYRDRLGATSAAARAPEGQPR
ncbi:MAG TPA: acyltransferase [Amaricoccus sp.]|uniref:acyltransferase family protein n=1 Tax=Amaricoccus sp. TaxID=1872485 RepID=UPI002CE21099|nr:acyltransferase [Amaricoccus sp.]HMQ94162.1 acyltransferase [Amaricoccus sp.]HMR54558.1 acyltransferase [Amaricoccus sp.]HMR61360.1 acyltransferase [Amaricoccus sp.]HMU01615.1 acyltransferase [Amaricoccus sp.]